MQSILEAAGPLPHGGLDVSAGTSSHARRKRQPSRPIKCACTDCGYTVHTTRRWLDRAGAPLCPTHGRMQEQEKVSFGRRLAESRAHNDLSSEPAAG
jgi:hypothetical protein